MSVMFNKMLAMNKASLLSGLFMQPFYISPVDKMRHDDDDYDFDLGDEQDLDIDIDNLE